MSWIERIKSDVQITTGDGVVYTPLSLFGSKTLSFNVSEFEFINVEGTYVDRREAKGRRFDLRFFFQGTDHIDVADAFEISVRNKKPWEIFHPLYGEFTCQPLSIKFDSSKLNTTEITTEVVETLTEEYPKAPNNPKTTAIDYSDDFSDASDEAFENVTIEVSEQLMLEGNLKDSFEELKTQMDESFNEYFNEYNEALNSVTEAQADTVDAIRKVRRVLTFPARVEKQVSDKIGMLATQLNLILNTVPNLVTPNDKLIFENNAGNTISSMIVAAVTPLDTDYQNSTEVLQVSDFIVNSYNNYLQVLDSLQTLTNDNINSYSPNFASIQALNNGVYYVSSHLLQIALNAQQERSVILMNDSDLINLTHRYYGLDESDENIIKFKESNNIGISEILEIKKGRFIKFYV